MPVAPWSRGAGRHPRRRAAPRAERIGYPLMLKATAGGGGRGIRMVTSDDELVDAYQRTRDEAARAFGSGVVFLERLVTGARHVEVQVIADGQGTAWALGVRDCSVQRRNQKVIEESASPVLDRRAGRRAQGVGRAARARGRLPRRRHGRVPLPPGEETFAFLEVNTRLQVEHPITEVTTDIDLVKAAAARRRRRPARGRPAGRGRARRRGPAQRRGPRPRLRARRPGRIALLELPAGPGIRVDTGVSEGDTIPADFDSMIAKIIAYGRTRDEALARLRRARGRDGGHHRGRRDEQELRARPARPARGDRRQRRHRLDRPGPRRRAARAPHRHAGRRPGRGRRSRPTRRRSRSSASGCSRPRTAGGRRSGTRSAVPIDLKLRGRGLPGHGRADRPAPVPGRRRRGRRRRRSSTPSSSGWTHYAGRLVVADQRFRLLTATHGPVHLVEVDGVTHRVSRDEGGVLRSPAPALVVATPVAVGAEVAAGRAGARPREHEDGDGAARAVRGAGARAARGRRQPGRDRRAAACASSRVADAEADGRRRRRRRPPSTSSCRRQARRPRRRPRGPRSGRPAQPAARLRRRPARRGPRPCPATCRRGPSWPRRACDVLAAEIDAAAACSPTSPS